MSATPAVSTRPKAKRRWFQYRLRTLLLLMTLVTVPLAMIGLNLRRAQRQREIVSELFASSSGGIGYDDATWLRRVIGEKYFRTVVWVDFNLTDITDEELRPLGQLSTTKTVILAGCASVTDVGVGHLATLSKLEELYLGGTSISDDALNELTTLRNLRKLTLDGTAVTDTGLVHLTDLTQLEELNLNRTAVSDAGLEYLKSITNLRKLRLAGTQVTGTGVKNLEQARPDLEIYR